MGNSDFRSGFPLTDRIAEKLRNDIIKGTIPAGTKLTVASVSNEFDVSGSPVREAFRMLASDGLLISDAYKGNTVAQVDTQFVKSIYDTVNALEIPLAIDAMKKISAEDLAKLRSVNERMKNTDDYEEFVSLNQVFHSIINDLSDNEIAKRIMNTYNPMIHCIRSTIQAFPDDRNSDVVREHDLIINALEEKNEADLRLILREHSIASREYAMKYFGKSRDAISE